MTRRALVVAPVVLALTVAACAADGEVAPIDADEVGADVAVDLFEMGFAPERLTVPAGGTVTLHLRNTGSLRHDLVLPDGTSSEVLNADETTLLEIGPLDEPVTAWCSIPGHRNAGMELEIVVE